MVMLLPDNLAVNDKNNKKSRGKEKEKKNEICMSGMWLCS